MRRWIIIILLLLAACEGPRSDSPRTIYASDEQTGVIAVTVPAGWTGLAAPDASIRVGNSGAAVQAYEMHITELEAGMSAGSVSAIIDAALINRIEDSPEAVLAYITGTMSAQGGGIVYTFGSIDVREIGGRLAAVTDGLGMNQNNVTDPEDDTALEIRVIVMDAGTAYGVLFIGAPFGELETTFEVWDSIAASFQFLTVDEARATQTAMPQQ